MLSEILAFDTTVYWSIFSSCENTVLAGTDFSVDHLL